MRLATVFRPFSDAAVIEGTVTEQARDKHDRQVREARLEVARRQRPWTEIPESRLVRRGPFLVDAETDEVFVYRGGQVFEKDRATIGFVPDCARLAFYVDEHDQIVFLEHHAGGTT